MWRRARPAAPCLDTLGQKWEYVAALENPMKSTHWETLLYRQEQGVAWIILDRPLAQNRVNLQMATEIMEICRQVREDDGIQVAVLSGSGEFFCAGDEEGPPPLYAENSAEQTKTSLALRRVAGFLGGIEKPIIAAIDGYCVAGGLELAMQCDIRIATEQFLFSTNSPTAFPSSRKSAARAAIRGPRSNRQARDP